MTEAALGLTIDSGPFAASSHVGDATELIHAQSDEVADVKLRPGCDPVEAGGKGCVIA